VLLPCPEPELLQPPNRTRHMDKTNAHVKTFDQIGLFMNIPPLFVYIYINFYAVPGQTADFAF
jgi:hypothetical protein